MPDFVKAQQKILANPLLWGGMMAKLCWDWKYLEGWQQQILLTKDKYSIINCSRKAGKSYIYMLKKCNYALNNPDSTQLIIADQRISNEDLRRARDILLKYKARLEYTSEGKAGFDLTTDNKTSIEIDNGARIIALPANEKARVYTDADVFIDEAGWVPDETYVAVKPIVTMGKGVLEIASTPNGPKGFYFSEWKSQQFTFKKEIPYTKCEHIMSNPEILKQIAFERQSLGEAYYQQEYCCQFLEDVATMFSEESLRSSIDYNQEALSDTMDRIKDLLN